MIAGVSSMNSETRWPERRRLRRGCRLVEGEGMAQVCTGQENCCIVTKDIDGQVYHEFIL